MSYLERGQIPSFTANSGMRQRQLKPCFPVGPHWYNCLSGLVRQKRCASIRSNVLAALSFCSWELFVQCWKICLCCLSMKTGSGQSTSLSPRPRSVLIIHSLFTLFLSFAWGNLSPTFLVRLLLSRSLFCSKRKPRCVLL